MLKCVKLFCVNFCGNILSAILRKNVDRVISPLPTDYFSGVLGHFFAEHREKRPTREDTGLFYGYKKNKTHPYPWIG